MDNGSIFPYRRRTAHAGQPMLTAQPPHRDPFGEPTAGRARDPELRGKRINRCDAGRQPGQAMVDLVQGRRARGRQIRRARA